MNDFTKEELENIRELITYSYQMNMTFIPSSLKNKIQSMIDNYCEHEKSSPYYNTSNQCDTCEVVW